MPRKKKIPSVGEDPNSSSDVPLETRPDDSDFPWQEVRPHNLALPSPLITPVLKLNKISSLEDREPRPPKRPLLSLESPEKRKKKSKDATEKTPKSSKRKQFLDSMMTEKKEKSKIKIKLPKNVARSAASDFPDSISAPARFDPTVSAPALRDDVLPLSANFSPDSSEEDIKPFSSPSPTKLAGPSSPLPVLNPMPPPVKIVLKLSDIKPDVENLPEAHKKEKKEKKKKRHKEEEEARCSEESKEERKRRKEERKEKKRKEKMKKKKTEPDSFHASSSFKTETQDREGEPPIKRLKEETDFSSPTNLFEAMKTETKEESKTPPTAASPVTAPSSGSPPTVAATAALPEDQSSSLSGDSNLSFNQNIFSFIQSKAQSKQKPTISSSSDASTVSIVSPTPQASTPAATPVSPVFPVPPPVPSVPSVPPPASNKDEPPSEVILSPISPQRQDLVSTYKPVTENISEAESEESNCEILEKGSVFDPSAPSSVADSDLSDARTSDGLLSEESVSFEVSFGANAGSRSAQATTEALSEPVTTPTRPNVSQTLPHPIISRPTSQHPPGSSSPDSKSTEETFARDSPFVVEPTSSSTSSANLFKHHADLFRPSPSSSPKSLPLKFGKTIRDSPSSSSSSSVPRIQMCVRVAEPPQPVDALRNCLEYVTKVLRKRDEQEFFAYPIDETIAPNYFAIIEKPMDFSTMNDNIEEEAYESVDKYKSDFNLMCQNAMRYNAPDTIYFTEARRLLSYGLKLLSKEKLLMMRGNFEFMRGITMREMGLTAKDVLSIGSSLSSNPKSEVSIPWQDQEGNIWMEVDQFGGDEEIRKEVERAALQRMRLRKFDSHYFTGQGRFQAIPDEMTPEEILARAKSAAAKARRSLDEKNNKVNVGFLRKKEKGEISFALTETNRVKLEASSSILGAASSAGLTEISIKEDFDLFDNKRFTKEIPANLKSKEIAVDKEQLSKMIELYQSHAHLSLGPEYSALFENMSTEEQEMMTATYGDEVGKQYAMSLQNFVAGCPGTGGASIKSSVDNLLQVLTIQFQTDHLKAKQFLDAKRQSRVEEQKRREDNRRSLEDHLGEDALKWALSVDVKVSDPEQLLTQNARDFVNLIAGRRSDSKTAPEDESEMIARIDSNLRHLSKIALVAQVGAAKSDTSDVS